MLIPNQGLLSPATDLPGLLSQDVLSPLPCSARRCSLSASSLAPKDSRMKSSFTLVVKAPVWPASPPHCEPLAPVPIIPISKTLLSSPTFSFLLLHPYNSGLERRTGEKETKRNGPHPHWPGPHGPLGVFLSAASHTALPLAPQELVHRSPRPVMCSMPQSGHVLRA